MEASRGGRGRGRARACQRVPGIIYDVRPMSLSAACLGLAASSSWTDRRASHLALPAFVPHFIGSGSQGLSPFDSVTVFPSVSCLSAFLVSLHPRLSVSSSPALSPSLLPLSLLGYSSCLWPSLHLSILPLLLSFSAFPLSHPLTFSLTPFHLHLAQAAGIGFLEGMRRESPLLPLPQPTQGRS